jgi:hypothetical protein
MLLPGARPTEEFLRSGDCIPCRTWLVTLRQCCLLCASACKMQNARCMMILHNKIVKPDVAVILCHSMSFSDSGPGGYASLMKSGWKTRALCWRRMERAEACSSHLPCCAGPYELRFLHYCSIRFHCTTFFPSRRNSGRDTGVICHQQPC